MDDELDKYYRPRFCVKCHKPLARDEKNCYWCKGTETYKGKVAKDNGGWCVLSLIM